MPNINPAIRFIAVAILLLAGNQHLFGQKPVIRSLNKTQGALNEMVTLEGNTFGNDPSKLAVFFGAAKGTIGFVSDQTLEVRIPAGTTYDNVSVTNLTSGLTGYSREQFLLSYGGIHGFLPTNLEGQKDFNAESGLYDLCACDFDGDNRVDIATANDNSNFISLLTNTTTGASLGTILFNKIPINIGTKSIHIKCGDLNGDGKPDLIVSEALGNDRVFVLQNTSTGTGNFTFATQFIKLTGKKVKQLSIADIDRNGKPEVIVTNQGGNDVSILINQSTLAAISFSATPIILTIPGAVSTDGIAVDDLDGDFFPEIAVSQFLSPTSNIFIIKNNSTIGNVAMGSVTTLPISGGLVSIEIGDLDGDKKPDIAATQLLLSGISIFMNQSSPGSLSFASSKSFVSEERPWGIDFGDLDGDGKTDIIVASLTKKALTIFNNESTSGNFVFQSSIKNTTFINKHINIVDFDNDGKPDIAFTSIDDNNNGIPASKISIFRNKSCVKPVVTPGGPLTVCSSLTPLRLFTTASRGVTYEWKNGATVVSSGTDSFLDVTASGNYSVTAIAEGGSCTLVSNTVNITVTAGTATPPVFLSPTGPVCIAGTLNLEVQDDGHEYTWTGPDNYTGTTAKPAAIPNFQLKNVGRYFVDVKVGGCIAQRASIVVDAIDAPDFQVTYSGSPVLCSGTKLLTVSPTPVGYSFQWYKDNVIIGGATATTFSAATTGNYSVKATNASCGVDIDSGPVKITFATTPNADFELPAEACMGQIVSFKNLSTSDPATDPFYTWDFGDGNSSTEKDPTHKFSSAALRTVKLTVTYKDGACADNASKSITIKTAPVVNITNPDNKYKLCSGDSLKLEVLGSFTSYQWNNNQSTSFIYVKSGGIYSVNVTTTGCTLNATKAIEVLEEPEVTITADPQLINEGQSSQLNASGLTTFLWAPSETLSNPTISNPIASPVTTTTYTVSGKNSNGCKGTASIEVVVKGEPIVDKLVPSSFISPNGDELNKVWKIEKIDLYKQCGVAIYDDKGIKIFEAKPYDEIQGWNGTYKGKQLPDGVYFYVIRCDGEENKPKTGSITILR